MALALILTPGLGVLAIVAIPVALVLVGTVVVERRIRRRRRGARGQVLAVKLDHRP